jgi:DNA-binding response OmpR family regulator
VPYSGNRRLLIIEDNPASAGGLAEMARRCKYQTLIASDPATGLEIAGWWQPDMVIIDLSPLGSDALATGRSMRQVLQKGQLVGLSEKVVNRIELDQAGFDRLLLKPVAFEVFQQSMPDC